MNKPETRRYEMFLRVQKFGDDFESRIPAESVGRQAFGRVRAALRAMSTHTVARQRIRGEAIAGKAQTRADLFDLMVLVRRTAAAMAVKRLGPDYRFDLTRRTGAEVLLTQGRSFVEHAEPFAADFIAHGMPSTFIADLRAAIAAFEAAKQRRASGVSKAASATIGFKEALADGLAAVRELDAIIGNVFRMDATVLAYWKHERRIGPARAVSGSPPTAEPSVTINPPDTTRGAPNVPAEPSTRNERDDRAA